ncbi:MAG: SDR family oxidoreductase [Acidobacteria bacterium]|nr:SDR family oxidoreductase [Acidobacteriota bacterium]
MFINKAAIITGASRGIGLAIARRLHAEGASVALLARSVEGINHGLERSITVRTDVRAPKSVESAVKRVVDRFGKIDIVVNNAGIAGMTPIDAPDPEPWLDIVNTNLVGTYYVTRAAVPHIPNGGRVMMMSSVLGKFGVQDYTAYCSAKAALIGFTRALAIELAPRKITVNALCPGWVETDMAWSGMRGIAESAGMPVEEFRRKALSRVPLREMVQPEEVAEMVVFLASDAAKNITAQAISICGGATQA